MWAHPRVPPAEDRRARLVLPLIEEFAARYASYYSPARPDEPLLAPMDRPHLEAHWEKVP